MYSTPFSLQTGISSAGSMGLEASEIWVSPWQNASKPSLVPAPPTSILASGFSSLNNSAAACVIGCTVLEPSILMVPETCPPPPLPPSPPPALPQAARLSESPSTRHKLNSNFGRALILNPCTPFVRMTEKTQYNSQGPMIGHCSTRLVAVM